MVSNYRNMQHVFTGRIKFVVFKGARFLISNKFVIRNFHQALMEGKDGSIGIPIHYGPEGKGFEPLQGQEVLASPNGPEEPWAQPSIPYDRNEVILQR